MASTNDPHPPHTHSPTGQARDHHTSHSLPRSCPHRSNHDHTCTVVDAAPHATLSTSVVVPCTSNHLVPSEPPKDTVRRMQVAPDPLEHTQERAATGLQEVCRCW